MDKGFVKPLTISQIEFCLFNEAEDETAFWSSQPDGSEAEGEGDLVGEMAGAAPRTPQEAQRALAGSVAPRAT